MELKDYTTEELRAELKKRNAEERAKKASVCLNCKYYVPAPRPFARAMCLLKEKYINRKNLVCKDWEYKYQQL